MEMNQLRWSVAAVMIAAPLFAVAGPYDQPYGLIESGDRSTNHKEEPASISRIDGQSTRNPRRSDPVPPGKHMIEISFSSSRTVVGDQLKEVELDVKPCKRYRIVAKYESVTVGKWQPAVQSVEDIADCKKKFLSGKSAK